MILNFGVEWHKGNLINFAQIINSPVIVADIRLPQP